MNPKGLGEELRAQREAIPHLRNRTAFAALLDVTPVHVANVEAGEAFPSGELLEKWLMHLEFSPVAEARLWEELARHQLDPVVESRVRVTARRQK